MQALNNNKFALIPRRVVLLGASGFVGRYLQRRLKLENIKIVAVSTQELDLSKEGAEKNLAEMLRADDAIVLLAAVGGGREQSLITLKKNIMIAESVIRALKQKSCAHLIYLSSDSVYPFMTTAVDERAPTCADTLYSAMHLYREEMFSQLVDVPLAILRVSQVYGYGDTHNAYGPCRMMRSAFQSGQINIFGSGEETRDHLYVDDLASIIVDLLKFKSQGLINIASGRSVSFYQLAQSIIECSSIGAKIVHLPRQMPIYHRKFDISLLRDLLPEVIVTKLECGLDLFAESMRLDFFEKRPPL